MYNKTIRRCRENPVITIDEVTPTTPNMQVVGIFNCGGTRLNGKTYLVCRTAEILDSPLPDNLTVPYIGPEGKLASQSFKLNNPELDFSDNRIVKNKMNGKVIALTSLSSFRLAVSEDGVHFSIGEKPCMMPNPLLEEWGMEDPRVTSLEDCLYLTYSSVSSHGVGVSLASTKDFQVFERMGMILPPPNKDAVLFPEKINGRYYLLHRPSLEGTIGDSDIWIADSPDLLHWGNHTPLCGCETGNEWESRKIGAGAPPLRVPQGWLVLYHGVDAQQRYSMGALLLDKDDPSIVLSRTSQPILTPEETYERSGFFAETVFPCTAFLEGPDVVIYYGAADNSVCRVDIPLETILE
ncbi:glycoside hydrolase family 130 protein [uncultured Sphaerochaeta sp.]|uniref:glycoside hydrolase family 130 protein n=1 Tax=uncultured Sphaerochaeta sp. TaxID=886478 RepID=UPI002A0A96E1|nr:glycoside hydrolase family 130 protein [uncultured Sphaerochaeta sp.]